jgi:hypothetical protein
MPATAGHNRLHNVRFFASSDTLAQRYSVIIGMPVTALPMMAYRGDSEGPADGSAPRLEPFAGVRIGYFGHASLEKGAHLLEDIVSRALHDLPNVQFVLHLNHNKDTEELLARLHKRQYPNVRSFWGHLSEPAIKSLRREVDIAFLPYNQKYVACPSMVFMECMVEGKPAIIPESTSMSYEAYKRPAAVVRFPEYTADSMFDAIEQAVRDVDRLKRQAARTAAAWREHHSIMKFVDTMIAPQHWRAPKPNDFGWHRLGQREAHPSHEWGHMTAACYQIAAWGYNGGPTLGTAPAKK